MKLNLKKLRAHLNAAQNERSDIEARLTEINRVLEGTGSVPSPAASTTGKRRPFSAATRAKMAAAAKERWAKRKGKDGKKSHSAVKSAKHKMSAAGRARIAAAAKARWAKAKAAGKNTLKG